MDEQRPGLRVGAAAVVLGLYLLSDWGLQALAMPGTAIIPWYPSAGLGLAFLVLTGWRGVPVLAAVRVALALFASPLGAAGWRTAPGALAIVVAYAMAADVIRRHVALDGRAWGIEDAAWLSGAVFGAAALAGLASAVEATLVFGRVWTEFVPYALSFATADAAGALVVVPVTLLVIVSGVQQLLAPRPVTGSGPGGSGPMARQAGGRAAGELPVRQTEAGEARTPGLLLEAALLLAVLVVVWRAGFAHAALHGYLCFVPLTVIALRHGVRGAAITIALFGLAFVAIIFADGASSASVRPAQLLLLALGTTGLFLGAARTAGLETDARYWHLLATAHEGIWCFDPEGKTLYASVRMAEMLGLTPEEMLGRPAQEFVAPEDRATWLEQRSDRAAGYTSTYEMRLVRRGGGRLPVMITASPVCSRSTGAVTGSVAVVADLSPLVEAERQRDQAESRERQGQRLLEAAFRTSSDAMILLRARDGLVLDVNESWCATTGVPREAVVGRPIQSVGIYDDVAGAIARLDAALDAGGGPATMEVEFRRHLPGGGTDRRHARITASRVQLDWERYMLVAGRDVTELRQAEERRAQIHRMEELGRLTGGVAHDFNNLLTIVQAYAQIVREAVAAGERVDVGDVREIERAAVRGSALTRRLLAFSRNQPTNPQPLDVNAAIIAAEGLLRPVLGASVRVQYELAASLPPVLLEVGQFDQVLLNLVLNARDSMPDGGEIRIATRAERLSRAEIEEAVREGLSPGDGDVVVLEVRDSGTGMTEETLARIFEPFYTTKAPGQGTGLGLPVVFGIVRQAGGSVRVRSVPGEGSCFTVRLPVAREEDPPRAGAGRGAGAGQTGSGETGAGETRAAGPCTGEILLVEDDDEVRRIAARALRRAGYAVREVTTGLEALERLGDMEREGCPPALVLSDVMMPGMDGGELALRLEQHDPSLPVLLMSGHVGPAVSPRRGRNVRGPILAKPFATADLLQAVADAIASRTPAS
ncbi:MAG: PAS domain-containing hybrid sensor histidine kinase/response regulator [Gemmatimonadaceae bacterium]